MLSAQKTHHFFKNTTTYFIRKGDALIPINTEKKLLETLADQKTAIQAYIRNHQLNFATMPAQTIIQSVELYQQLQK